MSQRLITYIDAAAAARNLTGNFDPAIGDDTYKTHIRFAVQRFLSLTGVYTTHTEITLNGSEQYSLHGSRVGQIYGAECQDSNSIIHPVAIRQRSWMQRHASNRAASAGQQWVNNICRYGAHALRVDLPQATGGTLRIEHAPIPVLKSRDSLEGGETIAATGSTATLLAVTTPTLGFVANKLASSAYYTPCYAEFVSGSAALIGVMLPIVGYDESGTDKLFTLDASEPLNATPAAGDKFYIRDVLEMVGEYALACIDYGAARVASREPKLAGLVKKLDADYKEILALAMRRSPDSDPAVEIDLNDDRDSDPLDIYSP